MCHKIGEADIRRKTRTKATADFLRLVMSDRALDSSSSSPEPELSEKLLKVEARRRLLHPSFGRDH